MDRVFFTNHANQELANDGLSRRDVRIALRGGIVSPGELERGTYRYRVLTSSIVVVVAVHAQTDVWVVTVWRLS